MTRKFLEDMGLDKEQIDSILNENSSDIGKVKRDLEKANDDLKLAKTEIETLKGTVKERDGQLEGLKDSGKDVADLKKQIEDLQKDNKDKDAAHAAEITKMKVDFAVNAALTAAHAKNVKVVIPLLDLEKAELLEDGTVKGLDEQIKKLQKAEDSSFLFAEDKKQQFKGTKPAESGNDDAAGGKVDFSKMNYDELTAYLEQHPDTQLE